MTFGSLDETAAFLKRCRKCRRTLRKDARKLGERLFAERARPFAERIESYWRIAAGEHAKPAADALPANVVAFGDVRTPRAS
jgi:hypothetical protein